MGTEWKRYVTDKSWDENAWMWDLPDHKIVAEGILPKKTHRMYHRDLFAATGFYHVDIVNSHFRNRLIGGTIPVFCHLKMGCFASMKN